LKREPSPAARSLRAVSLVLTVVGLVAASTLLYSGYQDLTGVLSGLSQGPGGHVSATTVVQGPTTMILLNVTVPNHGLYPLVVGLTCVSSNGTIVVSCNNASVSIPPGSSETIHLVMTLENTNQTQVQSFRVQGNLSLTLRPFASFSVLFPFVSTSQGGG
jgi:hypothetical protein